MRITIKGATPEQVEVFAQSLANTLHRPVFRWNKDQEEVDGTVLEFRVASTGEAESIQKNIVDLACSLRVNVMFWTYRTSQNRRTLLW